ncbi:unnamed protein product [Diamesa serratosioi]
MNSLKDPLAASGEELLRKFGSFLRTYKENLENLSGESGISKNNSSNLFRLDYSHDKENLNEFQLIESDNKLLNKILLVFYHLEQEVKRLNQESQNTLQTLIYVEDDISNSGENSDLNNEDLMNNAIVKFSFVLEDLLNMKFLVQNSILVSNNIIQQMSALYSMEKYINITAASSSFDAIGVIFKNLILFDNMFVNSSYKMYLSLYKDFIAKQNTELNETIQRNLLNCLHELELLMDGNILQIAVDSVMSLKSKLKPRSHDKLANCMLIYIRKLMVTASKYEDNISELTEIDTILNMNIFVVIYQNMFGNFDLKSLRTITDINNKFCAITFFNILWNGNEFLKKNISSLYKSNLDINKIQHAHLNAKIQSLAKDTSQYASQISLWIIQMHKESQIGSWNIKQDSLKIRCEMFHQGLSYAGQISHIIKSITNLHMKLAIAMPKQLIPGIYKLIEYLRIIKNTFDQYTSFIVDSIGFVMQHLQYQALVIVTGCKKKVSSELHKEKKVDILSSLMIAEKLLHGTVSINRMNVICLSLNLTEPVNTFNNESLLKLVKIVDNLIILSELQLNINVLCDSSFLFWHQNLLSVYFKQILDHPLNQRKVGFLLNSADECIQSENALKLDTIQKFHGFVNNEFEEHVMKKLCNSIEINLRLDFHSNLQVDKFNPFETTNSIIIEDRRELVKLNPIAISNEYICVKEYIEHYLSNMFYNLTTISLKDWRTYGEMRCLAERKYGLETVEDHLPHQTLDQGLDVLEIMRNIHIFVSKYLYNLNNQIFIEHSSKSKHLNTINIRNIANSLRTHGTGIVNTTVNYVYQFLRKKFFVFSQFIFDERIKSRLAKDLKHYRDNIDRNHQIYSYERANAFNRDIKKLGLTNTGESFLDQFRKLVSHIGNSMGYVRMIRSGCNHVCANASVCLPALDDELMFVELCKENGLSGTTLRAAEHLEEDIQQLSKNYSEGTLYFKLLVNTFIPFFRNPKHSHLKNFYIIVPALTINFIEFILTSKDKLNKKNKDGALFTDDGFAMGLIYVLKLLDQISEFNSLNWYKSIKLKIKNDREKIAVQRRKMEANEKDEKLSQTLLLSEKRLNAFQQEFELLFYNLSSAKIFFQN